MEHTNISLVETQTPEVPSRIIEYADLVKALRLSIAREMNVTSALDASSVEEALISYDAIDREHINSEIGLRFDEALIRFMGVFAIGRRPVVIRAGVDEGINGYLPWEAPLKSRLASSDTHDIFSGADIRIERFEPAQTALSGLGAVACRQVVETTAA